MVALLIAMTTTYWQTFALLAQILQRLQLYHKPLAKLVVLPHNKLVTIWPKHLQKQNY